MKQGGFGINRRDPEGVKADILRVATMVFVQHGFAGARIDEIARQTQATKRMIYYYFESKEGLFRAVISEAFRQFWSEEQHLEVPLNDPVAALRIWSEFRFNLHTLHGDLFRLCATEDRRLANFINPLASVPETVRSGNDLFGQILQRGVETKVFRGDIDALEAGLLIASYSSFHSIFRGTVLTIYSVDLLDSDRLEHARVIAGDMMVATLTAGADSPCTGR